MNEISLIYINEIFGPTIQGEGPNVGVKTMFVRVVGCDSKCVWCDSKYAWAIKTATASYSGKELGKVLVDECTKRNTSHVVLTGGNPCLYNFKDTINILHENNINVDIETQGTIFPKWLYMCDLIVFSPKPPSSTMKDVYDKIDEYLKWLKKSSLHNCICIKIPIFNKEDFIFAEKYYNLVENYDNVKLYLSVGNDNVNEEGDISKRILEKYKQVIEWSIQSNLKHVYIIPQVHTLIWGNKNGV